MSVKKIRIQDFGTIDSFSREFGEGINLVGIRETAELSSALGMVLNSEAPPPLHAWARTETKIEAEVSIDDGRFWVRMEADPTANALQMRAYNEAREDVTFEYRRLTTRSREEGLAEVFKGNEASVPLRFLRYADEDAYFKPRELSRRTDGMSELGTFRSYLSSFIGSRKPEPICDGKQYEIVLRRDGKYTVAHKGDGDQPVSLSASEDMLFHYLCFLQAAEFWHGFEEIRDLHGVKKPLIVAHFLERLDEAIDLKNVIQRTAALGRQVLFLTLPSRKRELWDAFRNWIS